MNDFESVKIGDFIEVTDYVANGSFASLKENVDYKNSQDYAVLVRLTDHNSGWSGGRVYITKRAYNFLKKSSVHPGDVIISNVGANAGTVFRAPDLGQPMSLGPNSVLLKPRDEKPFVRDFIYYYFSSPKGQSLLKSILSGSAQPKFNKTDLRSSVIEVPINREYKNYAEPLLNLDKKVELNRQINQTLEQIAQTLFKSWFVDFEPVKAKIEAKAAGSDPERAAMCAISGKLEPELDQLPPEQYQQLAANAALFPDELVESELGLIPVGWEVRKVESLLSRLSSKVRYTKDQVKPYGVTPVFEQGSGILLGYHDGTAQFAATPEEPAFIFGDHTCVTHLACEPFDISQNVIPLKGGDRPTLWVYYAVKDKQEFQEYRRHWMELVAKDAVVSTTPISQEFAGRVSIIHSMLDSNTRQNLELMTLRDTLLPKLLSGEIEVNQVD